MNTHPISTGNYFSIHPGKWKLASALGVTLLMTASTASAITSTAPNPPALLELPAAQSSASNDSIWLGSFGSLSNWKPVARDELILWSSPKRAYLVKIWRPHHSLRHSHRLGVTRTGGRVTTFDNVLVNGWRYPIKSIQRIDASIAKRLKYQTRKAVRS